MIELASRNVHRQGNRNAAAVPIANLLGGSLDDPLAKLNDEPARFRRWYEFIGIHQTALRIHPTHERFHADESFARNVDDRLKMQRKLVAFDRAPQKFFLREPRL